MNETPDDPIIGKHYECNGDVAECQITKMQYCLGCGAVVKAPAGATLEDVDKWAEETIKNAQSEDQERPRPNSKMTGMMIAAAAAMAAGGMSLAGEGLLPRRSDEPEFDMFKNFSVGSSGKHGGRARHTDRNKAKAARKARKKNRR